MLKDIKATNAVTEEKDTLGGGSFLWNSGIYPVTIKLAYLDIYPSGALNVNLIFSDADGKELNWKNCITNKKKEDFYIDKKTGEERVLPGMLLANSMTDIAVGKTLTDLKETPAIIEIYDFDENKKLPKEKDTLKELHGKRVVIGVVRELIDKNVKNNNGEWKPTGDTREVNFIDKFFFADGTTRPEKAAGESASFINDWKDRWEGKVKDSTSKDPAAKKAAAKKAVPRESLFPGK